MTGTKIVGNTYPVKDSLRALGGRWNADEKAWYVPDAKADEARKLVESGAGTVTAQVQQPYRPRKCVVCGAVAERNSRGYATVKIYRSGECGDCYEERKMGY